MDPEGRKNPPVAGHCEKNRKEMTMKINPGQYRNKKKYDCLTYVLVWDLNEDLSHPFLQVIKCLYQDKASKIRRSNINMRSALYMNSQINHLFSLPLDCTASVI